MYRNVYTTSLSFSNTESLYIHARTHTHIHTQSIHFNLCAPHSLEIYEIFYVHTYMHTLARSHAHKHKHTHTHIHIHAHTHTHNMYTRSCLLTNIHENICIHKHTYTKTHTLTHTHTITHTRTHTHTYTYANAHTHTVEISIDNESCHTYKTSFLPYTHK